MGPGHCGADAVTAGLRGRICHGCARVSCWPANRHPAQVEGRLDRRPQSVGNDCGATGRYEIARND